MGWIDDLRKKEGDKVRLVHVGDWNHEHWGFVLGNVYNISNDNVFGYLGFEGTFTQGEDIESPSENWGEWEFVRARSIVLENK